MFNSIKRYTNKRYRKNYRFYEKELSNFKTVLKDTNNSIVLADQYGYNCMSYAFGIFDDWLVLRSFENSFVDFEEEDIDYVYMQDVFYNCCEELEEKFAVRRVADPDVELAINERLIAFRIGADDFHFARRNSDGIWTHKPGGNTIREMTEEELLGEVWSDYRAYPYISEVAFFIISMQIGIDKYEISG